MRPSRPAHCCPLHGMAQTRPWGRFRHFMDLADPRCLLPSAFFGMSIDQSVELLQKYQENRLPAGVSDSTLWLAKKIKTSGDAEGQSLLNTPTNIALSLFFFY